MSLLVLNAQGSSAVTQIGTASKHQSSQALIVQSYALSTTKQQNVDFSGFDNLKQYQTSINNAIATAKDHGNYYLNTLLPSMITTVTNIDHYFNLQNAIPKALNPDTSAKDAIKLMAAVQEQAIDYQSQSSKLVTDLQGFRTQLAKDSSNFSTVVTNLNAAVNGDQGVLATIDKEVDNIDGKISGAIAGTVLSGLAIAGGVFMIIVGSVADFVTAGTSTPLVVGGIGVVAAGVGGEVASAIILSKLIDEKNALLTKKAKLKAEVNLALGMKSGFSALATSASDAATATQQMANAWSTLDNHLGNLISDLKSGQTTVDELRHLFQAAAQGDVKDVQRDITVIEEQLSGTKTVVKPDESLSKTVVQVAEDNKKAA